MTESRPRMLFVASSEASETLPSREAWAAPRLAASMASSVSPAISKRVIAAAASSQASRSSDWYDRTRARQMSSRARSAGAVTDSSARAISGRQASQASGVDARRVPLEQRVEVDVRRDDLAHSVYIGQSEADPEEVPVREPA